MGTCRVALLIMSVVVAPRLQGSSCVDLARDVDLLIYDAQYTEAEYEGRNGTGPSRRGWGHSTYVAATRVARVTGARRLVLTHHDPTHDDAMMDKIEREARALFPACRAARETMPIAV